MRFLKGRTMALLAIAMALLGIPPDVAEAQQRSGPVVLELHPGEIVHIQPLVGSGFRALLTFPGLGDLSGKIVHSARLVLPALDVSEPLTVEALARSRTPGVPGAWDGVCLGAHREATSVRPPHTASSG